MRQRVKKRRSKTKQWSPYTSESDCVNKDNSEWVNFNDTNPSDVCSQSSSNADTCICYRHRPGGRISVKCGNCVNAFLPTTVDGVSLEDIKKRKSDKLSKPKPNGSSAVSQELTWLEVQPDQDCEDISQAPESAFGTGSPSVICSDEMTSLDLHCLCVQKSGSVKNVCGICTMTLKIQK